ncbi:fibulin-1 isoform X1 [Polypterus senegalus]|uniref:fibulin-1 isoform X1 n=1 Tax=Polypterus senegalus TaxID=55291 RepID=UPI001964311D|nr:fibulin-1 isoform X1 [Polypterus senegalus]
MFSMGPSNVLFISFCGILIRHVNTQPSLETCCASGLEWANQKQDCAALPVISDLQLCRIMQEQCCVDKIDYNSCMTGVNLAKQQGVCGTVYSDSTTCEAKTIKRCCNCCHMGKVAQQQGMSCEQNLQFGYQCSLVFRACCVDALENNPSLPGQNDTTDTTRQLSIETETEDHYLNDQCRGAGQCSQRCLITESGASCSCFEGYKLKPDGRSCEDINECLLGSHHCLPGEGCINTLGSYRCQRVVSCGTGYELTDSNKCQDIDECEIGTHNCAPDFVCQNTQGSFRCRPKTQCGNGFIQDALGNCIDINECVGSSNPCPTGQSCLNTVGSFSCHRNALNCGRGYHLKEDGTRCVDIDECSDSTQPCGEGHICINSPGTYRCECSVGYYFDSISRTCLDINECRRYPGRLCAHKCENLPGSYYCSCTTGFKLGTDKRNCEDVNECDTNPCSQECANVYGSYQCYCRRGYQLSDVDGITCEDIDECALPNGGHICTYRCINVPGSFQCTCPPTGYTLASGGRSCQDIDECVTGTHNCTAEETCFNIQGSFKCLMFECPKNYRQSGRELQHEKVESIRCIKSCQPHDISCIMNNVHTISYTVISLPTYRDFFRPEEIIFLRLSPSHLPMPSEIVFNIVEGDEGNFFDVIKRVENNIIMGVVRQVKQIVGPAEIVLKLATNFTDRGIVSHRNIVNVHIFVSEHWF